MDLTKRLRGKQVAAVMTNGHVLAIRTEEGDEIRVVWLDDNGEIIKGRPFIERLGVRLNARSMHEIANAREQGVILIGKK